MSEKEVTVKSTVWYVILISVMFILLTTTASYIKRTFFTDNTITVIHWVCVEGVNDERDCKTVDVDDIDGEMNVNQ